MNRSSEDQRYLELLRQGKLEKDSLTQEQWRDILLGIIKDGQATILEELLLKFDVFDNLYEKRMANSDQSTIFGQTCLKFYNKDVIQILHKAGINHIGKTEMQQLLAAALSPANCEHVKGVKGDLETSSSKIITEGTSEIKTEHGDPQPTVSGKSLQGSFSCGSSVSNNEENEETPMLTQHEDANTERSSAYGRNLEQDPKGSGMVAESTNGCTDTCSLCTQSKLQTMDNLRDILTLCRFSPLAQKLLDLSDCEHLKTLSHKGPTGWLYNFLRYGEMDTETKPVLALTQMECCDWASAKETISSYSGKKDLLNKHIYISFPSQDAGSDWTLLSYAVHSHRADVVQLMLELGVDPNTFCGRNVNGTLSYFTPFELSVEIGNSEICSLLVQHDANIYLQSTGAAGKILKNAIRNGNVEILKIILAHRRFPYDYIIKYIDKLPELQNDIIKRQALKDVLRFDGVSVQNDVFLALEKRDFEAAKCFIRESDGATLSEEVNVLYPPHEGEWLLVVFAARQDSFEVIQLLRDKGVSINTFCNGDRSLIGTEFPFVSPLFEAILNDNVDLCSKLLQHGAQTSFDVGLDSRYHAWTAAFQRKNREIYKLLLHHTQDDGFVFLIYMTTCMNAVCDVQSVYNVYEVFPLDVLKMILQFSPISESTWLFMFMEVSYSRPGSVIVRKVKRMLLQLLFNFQPRISRNLRAGWRRFCERGGRLPPDTEDTAVEDWFTEYSLKCPSLQSLSRSVIRNTCVSCEPEAIHSLGLPITLEEYMQLPPSLDDPDLPLEI